MKQLLTRAIVVAIPTVSARLVRELASRMTAKHRLEVLLPGIEAMSFPATGIAPLRSGRITIRQ
jgi:hypothetical protein